MSRIDELRARDERQAAHLGLERPDAAPPPSRKGRRVALSLAVFILLVVAVVLGYIYLKRQAGGDADERLARVAEDRAAAVAYVVAALPDGKGTSGTAWAVADDLYATNAHVVAAVAQIIKAGGQVQIRVNRKPNLRFDVVGAGIHPRYGDDPLGYDVGLLRIDGKAPAVFPVASTAELNRLASGYRIAYLGFPSENLFGSNVNVDEPIATMQSGIVTAVSDFALKDSGFAKNQLVRHNLAAVGGASGSPVFNADGKVVAILNAVNVTTQVVTDEKGKPILDDEGKPKLRRAPSAAQINFAQRIDLLQDIEL